MIPQPPAWPPDWPEIQESINCAMASGDWGRYQGAFGDELRQRLSELVEQPLVRLCSSGTIAVELALRAIGIGPGDEVILGAYDFPGNFRSIEATGARPVLVDMDPATGCLDPRHLPGARGDSTRAVLVSHLHGGIADMPEICLWANTHRIPVVEDVCQAPGAQVHHRRAGSWGDISVLSFGGSKLLTAGRGGAVATGCEEFHQRLRVFSDRGNDAFPLSELQAAVLLPQIPRLESMNRIRQRAAQRLASRLRDCVALQPVSNQPGNCPAYYKWSIQIGGNQPEARSEWICRLQSAGITIGEGFRGFTRRSERRCRRWGTLPVAADMANRLAVLHHTMLLLDDIGLDQLAETMITCLPEHRV